MSEPVEGDGPPQDTRPMIEILEPPGSKGRLRDLPLLLARSLHLVYGAGRRDFLVTAGLQLAVALGVSVQLYVNQAVLHAVLSAGEGGFTSILPELALLVALMVAIQ